MKKGSEKLPDGLLVSWLGDDFTGSAAVMEVLTFAGLPSVLFLDVPTKAQLSRFDGVRGLGIASTARSHSPVWMEENLPRSFEWLASRKAPITHYKACSTLDSAPDVGSIGKAIDLASAYFKGWIPCFFAAPDICRYQAFGNLFASAPNGIHRLDRHPIMQRHPVTPMTEADVAEHLSRQTTRQFRLINLLTLRNVSDCELPEAWKGGDEIISIDTVSRCDLQAAGALMWKNRGKGVFAVGSQGVEYALVAHWQNQGLLDNIHLPSPVSLADQMIAVSGSVSPVTATQIEWAENNGFTIIPLDAARLVRNDQTVECEIEDAALKALSEGTDPLIVTARGPDDASVLTMRQALASTAVNSEEGNARIGQALGRILRNLLRRTKIRRCVISGGDTSGHAARQLDIFAFTALAPTIPGAALLKAHSENTEFDGLELALKGGQMGSPDYFGWIKRGGGAA